MRHQILPALAILLLSALGGGLLAQQEAPRGLEDFRKALVEAKHDGLRVDAEGQKAVDELVKLGTNDAVVVLKDFLTTYGGDRKVKQQAVAGLGRIGSKEAVAAIDEFQKWAGKTNRNPPDFRFGQHDHPIDHYAPADLKPLATGKDQKGVEWAVFALRSLALEKLEKDEQTIWAVRSTGKDTWTQPALTDLSVAHDQFKDMRDLTLTIKDGSFTLKSASAKYDKSFRIETTDSDDDGLVDAYETTIGTDPKQPDTDRDEVIDEDDGNPLTPKHKQNDDQTQIRQAVFSILFATCNAQDPIVLVGLKRGAPKPGAPTKPNDAEPVPKVPWEPYARQEYYGYGGPVLRSEAIVQGRVNITGIEVKLESADSATATIDDWEGPEAGSVHEAKLKRIHGRWVVIKFGTTRTF